MHKEELINLHQMLYDVKVYFEALNPNLKFAQYNALKITPPSSTRARWSINTRSLCWAPRLPMR